VRRVLARDAEAAGRGEVDDLRAGERGGGAGDGRIVGERGAVEGADQPVADLLLGEILAARGERRREVLARERAYGEDLLVRRVAAGRRGIAVSTSSRPV
jgi:hypothetical protein